MGWMHSLCNAYDSVIDAAFSAGEAPLIPVGFTQKDIKFHVILNRNGEFEHVQVWDDKKEKHYEIVPSTPQAEIRTGKVGAPFPLAEQLKYFIPTEETPSCYQKYMAQLSAWCQEDAPECLHILKQYLEQHNLLQDLTEIAHLSESVLEDQKAFVTFSVYGETPSEESALWKRSDVRESWSRRIARMASGDHRLCYVEGTTLPVIEKHPKVQRLAKLISSKDNRYPFIYKGRFVEDRSAATISYDASIRAHNALDWLVKRQGFSRYGMTFVAWNTNGCYVDIPVCDNPLLLAFQKFPQPPDTYESYAKELRNACLGLSQKFLEHSKTKRSNEVSILGMEAATKGRMSITYYQELPGNTYVEHLRHWYTQCTWGKLRWEDAVENGRTVKKTKLQIFTPSPLQIGEAVIGTNAVQTARGDLKCEKSATKLMRETNLRLMSCIAGEAPVPHDMVVSALHHAVSPLSFTDSSGNWAQWKWMEIVATACALIHREQEQEHKTWETAKQEAESRNECCLKAEPPVFNAILDTASCDRDYLYGRLLASAHYAECLSKKDYTSQTNAVRLFLRFTQRPWDTWPHLHDKLLPYLSRLSQQSKQEWMQSVIGSIECQFTAEALASKRALGPRFLQGFHSQYLALSCGENSLSNVSVFPQPRNRSDKFGCLLAIADYIELKAGEHRNQNDYAVYDHAGNTTAQRMMPAFAARPVEIWEQIHSRLIPYLENLEKQAAIESEGYQRKKALTYNPHFERNFADLLGWAESCFTQTERSDSSRLNRDYLNSYYRTKKALLCHVQPPKAHMECSETLSREMLYGRLLGLENQIERFVMNHVQKIPAAQYRPSNAVRLMPNFAKRPADCWEKLEAKLVPYRKHLPAGMAWLTQEIENLNAVLAERGWNNNTLLNGTYLTYYYRTNQKKEN